MFTYNSNTLTNANAISQLDLADHAKLAQVWQCLTVSDSVAPICDTNVLSFDPNKPFQTNEYNE